MPVLPQTPLDWVLLAVAATTGVIIAVALQDVCFDSRVNNPGIRALQDEGEACREYSSKAGLLVPSLPAIIRQYR